MSEKESEYVSISEFTKEYHYSDRHVRRLIREDKLEAIRLSERGKWLIKKGQQIEAGKQIQKRKLDIAGKYKEHEKGLVSTLQKLIENFRLAQRYGSVDGLPIEEIVVKEEDRNQLHSVESLLSRCLLSHIQLELPELRGIKDWGQLRPEDITDELLDKLSLMSYRRTFQGKCDICQGWM